MADFMLNAEVQLQRARRLVIGVQYIGCTVRAYAGSQEVADVTGVGSLQIKRIPSLHLLEEREDRWNLVADAIVVAAEIGLALLARRYRPACYRDGLRQTVSTSVGRLVEGPGLQAQRPIKQNVVENYVLVVKRGSTPNHGLAVL